MYAIIETGGKQYWVIPGEKIRVEKLEVEGGKELTFKALWAADDAKAGQEPSSTQKATVTAEVVRGLRAPKILVFKKRTKKAYKKMKGHRQNLTEILIKSISFN